MPDSNTSTVDTDYGIPLDCRLAFVWARNANVARRVLRDCASLRRLYRVALADDPIPAVNDPRILVLRIPDPASVRDVVWSLFEADTRFFIESRLGWYLPVHDAAGKAALGVIQRCVLDFVRLTASVVAYQSVHGWHNVINMLLNLDRAVTAPTVDCLAGRRLGQPVVVVGAGPALDRNLHILAEQAARITLVACDAAWRSLDKAGIVPDLVVTTDGGDLVWRFLATLSERQRAVPLVCLLHSSWPAVRHHSGPCVFGRQNRPLDQILTRALGLSTPVFDVGECVGHAAFEVARLMGASPLIMMGFNLGYEGKRFHPKDMAAPVFDEMQADEANVLYVPGIDGKPVRTELSFHLYLREFERRIAVCGQPVWDATEAGALKKGTRIVTLKQALNECLASAPAQKTEDIPTSLHKSILAVKGPGSQWLQTLLRQWQDATPPLLTVLDQLSAQPESWLGRRQVDPFVELKPFRDWVDLAACAGNGRLDTAFWLAWEDWINQRVSDVRPVVALALEWLDDLRRSLQLVAELAAWQLSPQPQAMRRLLAVTAPGAAAAPWSALLDTWVGHGWQVDRWEGDPHDIPAIWRALRLAGKPPALMLNSALFPAAWHLPGGACLDVRLSAPQAQGQDYVLAENWLNGYAVLCVEPSVAAAWQARLPLDRRVFLLQPDTADWVDLRDQSVKSLADLVAELRIEAQIDKIDSGVRAARLQQVHSPAAGSEPSR